MDIKQLKRDASVFSKFLFVTGDNRLVTKERFEICIPSLYENHNFCEIASNVTILGIFAMIKDGVYAVNKLLAKVTLSPMEIRREKIDEEEYLFFVFEPGSTVCENMDVLQEDTNTYYVYDHFIANGKIPWFFNYMDILTLYHNVKDDTGVKLGDSTAIMEMIGTTIARNPKEGRLMFRTGMKSLEEAKVGQPFWVPLTNVQFGAADTTSKILGSYFSDGLNSALVYKNENIDPVESVLRS